MAKPVLPEGYTVVYEYGETNITHDGRELLFPHRYTSATVINEGEDEVYVGVAICREGPARDEKHTTRYRVTMDGPVRIVAPRHAWDKSHSYDQFSRRIGRDIALGRALKKLVEAKEGVTA